MKQAGIHAPTAHLAIILHTRLAFNVFLRIKIYPEYSAMNVRSISRLWTWSLYHELHEELYYLTTCLFRSHLAGPYAVHLTSSMLYNPCRCCNVVSGLKGKTFWSYVHVNKLRDKNFPVAVGFCTVRRESMGFPTHKTRGWWSSVWKLGHSAGNSLYSPQDCLLLSTRIQGKMLVVNFTNHHLLCCWREIKLWMICNKVVVTQFRGYVPGPSVCMFIFEQ